MMRRDIKFDQAWDVYTAMPEYKSSGDASYVRTLRQMAMMSEEFGCRGMLIFTNNSQLDPWLLAQAVMESTKALSPLVAVQPIYMHPFAVAKMITTLATLHRRRVALNMVAGGFPIDHQALDDSLTHDDRYARLVEHVLVIQGLLAGESLDFDGKYYRTRRLRLMPPLPGELAPNFFVAGSSDAGIAAAATVGATSVVLPSPDEEGQPWLVTSTQVAVRVGIIARPSDDQAWNAAEAAFPPDREGAIKHRFAMALSDSSWRKRLDTIGRETLRYGDCYWLEPFMTYRGQSPFLVGSYERVGSVLRRFLAWGCRSLILNTLSDEAELFHVAEAVNRSVGSGLDRVLRDQPLSN
jgi:alkanesulfonate monooxygenase